MKKMRSVLVVMAIALVGSVTMSSCNKDDDMEMSTFDYAFNTGQVGAGTAYDGTHPTNFTAMMEVEELDDDRSRITVTLWNTINGEMYMIHAHDAADASTTPNGTPYNESPNSAIFVQMATGNGSTVEVSQEVDQSYDFIVNNYAGFFVVHDPTQAISTVDLTTYLVVGSFAREQ